jgi:hypothetical protein
MTLRRLAGSAMISMPFIGVFVFASLAFGHVLNSALLGVLSAIGVFVAALAVSALILCGILLCEGSDGKESNQETGTARKHGEAQEEGD